MTDTVRRSALLLATAIACARETAPPEPRVATTIEVAPGTSTLSETQTQQFIARVRDQKGELLSGVSVTWQSNHPEAVTIDSTGKATAAASFLEIPGTIPDVSISAVAGSLTGTATVTVLRRGTFNAWPDTNVLYVGMTRALKTRLVKSLSGYPGGSLQDSIPNVAVSWSSSDANIMTVSDTGLVTGVAAGHARVIAKYDNRVASAEVFVTASPATPLRFTSISSRDVKVRAHLFYPAYWARACGLATDGSIYCWGAALDSTQITDRCEITIGGAGGYTTTRFRCSEIPLRQQADVAFTGLTADGSCGLATSKRVYCLVAGTNGLAPIASTDEFTAIYGRSSICGLRTDGALLCWGGTFGPSPRAIDGGVTWRTIEDGGGCGLAVDSTAYCFGSGTAQRVGGTARWKSIASSYRDGVCALALDGSVHCGSNLETTGSLTQPVTRLGTYWSFIATDFVSDVCGLSTSGDVSCRSVGSQRLPDVKLQSFYGHCGIATDDKVYCWRYDPLRFRYSFALVPGQ
ncbi:MAG TPA: Ig-like domain-containing protein [Gemmatimonadaceae bacterium]